MMTTLVTNEKWLFPFPWCQTLGVHPPLRCDGGDNCQIFSFKVKTVYTLEPFEALGERASPVNK